MSLFKRPNSEKWWCRFTIPGYPRVCRSTDTDDEQAAQAREDEFKVELRKQDPALRGKSWGNAVIKWAEAEDRSDSDILSLAKFATFYPDRMLTEVTPENIDAALKKFCKTSGTYTRYRTRIGAILVMSGVDLKLVAKKKNDKKEKPRDWITHEQWVRLRAQLKPHMLAMATFAVTTGLRQANVLGLQWKRVDLKRKVAWVEAAEMKGGAAINVPLSEEAINVLISVQGQHPEFCFTYRGKPVKEVKTAWQAACVRAGVGRTSDKGRYSGFTWHGLRHTWATWHVQSGTPIEVLQRLGGWSDLRMVMKYAHHAPGFVASYANNINWGKGDE
jgi:integrase